MNSRFGGTAYWTFLFALMLNCVSAFGAEPLAPAKPDDLIPGSVVAALIVPDLGAAREQAANSQLGKMLAQPEPQAFLRPIREELAKIYAELRTNLPPAFPALDDLNTGLFTGELALAIVLLPDAPRTPVGVLQLYKPKDPAALQKLLDGLPLAKELADGQAHKLVDGAGFAVFEGRVYMGSSVEVVEGALVRTKDGPARATALSANEAYQGARKRLEKSVGFLYCDRKALNDLLLKALPREPAAQAVQAASKALGLDNLTCFALGFGFSDGEPVLESWIGLHDARDRKGLWAVLGEGTPVNADDLKIVPADAPYVSAGSMHPGAIMPLITQMLTEVYPQGAGVLDMLQFTMQQRLGVDLQKDLLENMVGPFVATRCAFETSSRLGGFWGGMMFWAPLKDPARLEDALKAAAAAPALHAPFPADPFNGLVVRKLEHHGKNVYYFYQNLQSSVALCVVGDHVLLGTGVNDVKRGLEQLEKADNILASKDFQATLARISGKPFDPKNLPAGFTYAKDESAGDGSLVLSLLMYGSETAVLALVAESTAKAGPTEGPDHQAPGNPLGEVAAFLNRPSGQVLWRVGGAVDPNFWPDEGFFAPYRHGHGALQASFPDGLYSRTDLPLPLPGSNQGQKILIGAAAIGVIAGITLPVLSRARESAKRTKSLANMDQIMLACTLYSNDHNGEFPKDPFELYPQYIRDAKMFVNPLYPDKPDGYIYVAGQNPEDNGPLVFENPPPDRKDAEVGVAYLARGDTRVPLAKLKEQLAKAAEDLKKDNRELKLVPIDIRNLKQ